MSFAEDRAFARIPGTDNPSLDGVLYQREGFDILSKGFAQAGWQEVTPNKQPTAKNHTYGRTTYMFDHGERGGPLATYLQTALKRPNFSLYLNTAVKRVIRDDAHATGVELECNGDGGYAGKVNLTPNTGRVILSAGTFGSAKLLLRSTNPSRVKMQDHFNSANHLNAGGIGPADQLSIVASSTDGPTMIAKESWINLPVGSNLVDHLNVSAVL